MYSVFAYIHHKNQLNVAKYTIHGWYGWGKKNLFGILVGTVAMRRISGYGGGKNVERDGSGVFGGLYVRLLRFYVCCQSLFLAFVVFC